MRKQQEVWQQEHEKTNSIPSLSSSEPARGVVKFVEFLKNNGIQSGKAVDIGCGKGRNTVYLAKSGFETYGIDYIPTAIRMARQLAEKNGVAQRVKLKMAEIDKPWPFEDEFFDVAIDSYSSIDIETLQGRQIYKDEMLRTLKKGGYARVMVVSARDEIESEFIKSNPGQEKNSVVWPSGKFQKDYDEEELREFYKKFNIIE